GILTLALMALLVSATLRQTADGPKSDAGAIAEPRPFEGAEACVTDLLDRARVGDVSAYLDAFVGPLRDRIEREAAAQGRDAFAAELKRVAQSRRSHAVFAPEPNGLNAASVDVEFVYNDRNERQTYHLEQSAGGWRVTDVATLRSQVSPRKLGAIADYREP